MQEILIRCVVNYNDPCWDRGEMGEGTEMIGQLVVN